MIQSSTIVALNSDAKLKYIIIIIIIILHQEAKYPDISDQ